MKTSKHKTSSTSTEHSTAEVMVLIALVLVCIIAFVYGDGPIAGVIGLLAFIHLNGF